MKKIVYILLALSFSFQVSAQLQNLDFELCDTSTFPQLEGYNCRFLKGWTRTNGTPFSEGYSFNNENGGVSDAYSGKMALRLSVWYTHDKDMAYQSVSYTSFPTALKGFYTYTDNLVANRTLQIAEPDTATVTVLLSKWNTILNQRDTIGFGKLQLNAASAYTAFSCAINYRSNATPDSILLNLNCSRLREQPDLMGNLFGNNSYFTIDKLSLEGNALGVTDISTIRQWAIYPNPGSGIIHIPSFNGQVSMSTIDGKLITSQSYPDTEIDASLLPSGVYILRLTDRKGLVGYAKYVRQ